MRFAVCVKLTVVKNTRNVLDLAKEEWAGRKSWREGRRERSREAGGAGIDEEGR
jgi:hypothetical protein